MLLLRVVPVSLTKSLGGLLCIKLKGMATKANLDLHTPVSKLSGNQKNKKLKGSMEHTEESTNGTIKKNTIKSYDGPEDVRNDPDQLDSLTVQELKTIARSVGLSAKGNKKQLISTLKCFYSTNGAGSCTSTPVEDADPETMPPKRKAKSSLFEDSTQDLAILPDSSKKKQKSTSKKEFVECATVETDSTVAVRQRKCSSSTKIVEKKSTSKLSRSVSTHVQSTDVVVSKISPPQASAQPWTVLAHKKPQKDWIPYNPNTMRPPPLSRDTNFVKLMSWNVNGLRALLKLESFSALELAQKEDFDVLCLQETKIQEKDVEKIKETLIDGYDHSFWTCSISKLGYSGTAIISRIKPISVKYGLGISDHDSEGRLVTVEFDSFFLLCSYVPNSGDGLRRLTYRVEEWDQSLSNYMKELEKVKPVILTGDLNCCHEEIDIYDPAGNRRSAGFTIEERESFERNFLSRGFVDTFRKQHPGVVAYSYWGYRHGGRKTNKGWRLDYFLASESIADKVYDSYILPEVGGSDHCPIGLILKV